MLETWPDDNRAEESWRLEDKRRRHIGMLEDSVSAHRFEPMQPSSQQLDLLLPVYHQPALPAPSMKEVLDCNLSLQPPPGASCPLPCTPASAFHKATHKSFKSRTHGKWCALHASIAWHIYHNEKNKTSKPDESHREPASQFPAEESDWPTSRSTNREPARGDTPEATSDLRASLPAPVWEKPVPNWTKKTEEDVSLPGESKPDGSQGCKLESSSSFVRVKRSRQEVMEEPPVFAASSLYCPRSTRPSMTSSGLVSYPGAETFQYRAVSWEPTWSGVRRMDLATVHLGDYFRSGCKMPPAVLKHREVLRSFAAPYFSFPSARRQQEAAYLRGGRTELTSESLHLHLWKQHHCHSLLRYPGYLPAPYLGP